MFDYEETHAQNRVDSILGLSPLQIKSIMIIFIFCMGALAFSHIELNNKYNVLETQYYSILGSQTEAQNSLASEIVYETLQMAIPSFGALTHDASTIILSTELIEDVNVPRRVKGYRLLLLSPEEIEAKALAEGDFLYLHFTKFDPNPENMMVNIEQTGIFDMVQGMNIQFKLTGITYYIWIS